MKIYPNGIECEITSNHPSVYVRNLLNGTYTVIAVSNRYTVVKALNNDRASTYGGIEHDRNGLCFIPNVSVLEHIFCDRALAKVIIAKEVFNHEKLSDFIAVTLSPNTLNAGSKIAEISNITLLLKIGFVCKKTDEGGFVFELSRKS